jgi:hypothetical protein
MAANLAGIGISWTRRIVVGAGCCAGLHLSARAASGMLNNRRLLGQFLVDSVALLRDYFVQNYGAIRCLE